MPEITFTLDLEDPRPNLSLPRRYELVTRKLLGALAESEITGTFFVVATLAEKNPPLVREIARYGHEIALHSFDHTPLPEQDEKIFRLETQQAKETLEAITGTPCLGYRAPIFSLTKDSLWAPSVLTELGFTYSSSVLPVVNLFYGFPEAPKEVFKWPSGLIEFPAPIGRVGLLSVPFLGGVYFRYLPISMVRRLMKSLASDKGLWAYSHPHDFDADEKFFQLKNTSLWASYLLWLKRAGTYDKFQQLFNDTPGVRVARPLGERCLEIQRAETVPVFNYAAPSVD